MAALYDTNKFGYKYVRYDRRPNVRLVKAYVDKYKINTDCHHSCITCQITHIDKYRKELELDNAKSIKETGKPLEKWFPVKCNYITKGMPWIDAKEKLAELSHNLNIDEDRAKKILLSGIDSGAWIELMFGFDDKTQEQPDKNEHWYLRWYQKLEIRCTSKRLVLRAGRRSGKSAAVALKLIHLVFTNKVFAGYNANGQKLYQGPEIVVITPFTSQAKNIFGDIERFLRTNKDLMEQVNSRGTKLYTQSPPLKMEFKNGASITGYVSGANAKDDETGGGMIRGDNAHIIYLDEMDMIPDSILQKAINPLLLTRPGVMMFGSSTPIGKKGVFYKWALERPDFKEVYVPSTVLPHWDEVEKEALDESTEDAFKAEYMADFIEQQAGVFKHRYIQEARTDYTYEEAANNDFWLTQKEDPYQFRINIGIDWNKNAGTEYSVVGFSPRTGNFYLLESLNIPPSEFSGEAYKETVKQLNFKWKPHYIYPDEGYGHSLIEDLQVEAQNLGSKPSKSEWDLSVISLGDKLKPINFSSNLQLFNPATGTYFEKYAKNFLVENTVRLMERGRVKIPEAENILIKQMGNYIVKKQLDSGKNIYGQNNEGIGDHRLDAFLLAMGGIAMEESIFSANYDSSSTTHFIENKEEDTFESSMEEALGILNVIKKQKSGVELNVLSVRRGNGSREQERAILTSQGFEEQEPQQRSQLIKPSSNKGYFSERGLAKFTETGKGEDIDINMTIPTKINRHSRGRGHIRKQLEFDRRR